MFRPSFTCVLLASGSLVGLGAASVAQAQPTASTASDLQIGARYSLDFNTPRSGDEGNSFSQVSAFFPLFQLPGRHLTFLTTAGRLDTQGNVGGNVAVGHRLAIGDEMVLGGYVAYDIRDTEQNTFSQIGLGAELKGAQWETYVNGYVPIGTTSAASGDASGSGQAVNTRFQGNQLLLVTGGAQPFESALGSLEAGAGLRLGEFGRYGNLWGYGSAYYAADSLGGSVQLDHRVSDRFRWGLGAQSDGIFGTQVFASVGTSLGGGQRPRSPGRNRGAEKSEVIANDQSNSSANSRSADNIWLRLAASSIQRNSNILVRSEMRGTASETQVAVNPETGEDYRFRHVTPDAAGANQGNGSVANPFTTLGTSAGDTDNTGLRSVSDGDLVYVQVGDSRTNALAPFTIPSGVQVYSSATAVSLPTQFGSVTLAGADSNNRPLVTGGDNGITLTGGDNRVSGFEIVGSANGIYLNNAIGTVAVENNLIRNVSDRALFIEQSAGEADLTITNNQIDTAVTDGIRVNLTDTANFTLALTNNQISNITTSDGDGIDIEANGTSTTAISITDNQIDGAGNSGIELETCGDSVLMACNANFMASVSRNNVTNSGGDGILFFHNSDQTAQITIDDNQVQQSGVEQTGVTRNADNPLPVDGNGGFGIMAATFADGDLEIAIANNTITDTQDEKIAILNNLKPNTASATTTAAPLVTATIQNNTLSGSGEGLIAGSDVAVISGSVPDPLSLNEVALCLQLQDNTSDNGYYLSNGLVATPALPFPPVTFARAGTFERANISDNVGVLTTSGTLTLDVVGSTTVSSPGTTEGTCTIP
ncbi:MAG: inverse autotransporter beta domain-containing protein [Phormidesmis sp.]